MPIPDRNWNESVAELLPLGSKEGRTLDAELIRQEFVKSSAAKKSSPREETADVSFTNDQS